MQSLLPICRLLLQSTTNDESASIMQTGRAFDSLSFSICFAIQWKEGVLSLELFFTSSLMQSLIKHLEYLAFVAFYNPPESSWLFLSFNLIANISHKQQWVLLFLKDKCNEWGGWICNGGESSVLKSALFWGSVFNPGICLAKLVDQYNLDF